MLALLALLLLLAGGALYLASRGMRRASGLPAGEIIYTDASEWRRNDRPLFSNRYRLVGKPDYLVQQGEKIIPVEVKSTHIRGQTPYDSHRMQLAAYCLLVEDVLGVRPSHGILKYADATFRVPFTDALRRELLATLQEMREAMPADDIPRSHSEPIRCRFCGYRDVCGQAL